MFEDKRVVETVRCLVLRKVVEIIAEQQKIRTEGL